MQSRRPLTAGVLAVLTITLLLAGLAEASVLRAFTLPELRSASDAIVTGRVLGARSVQANGTIETVVRVRVTEAWQGRTGRTIRVRLPGGQVDGRRLVVPGVPTLERGDEAILFLYEDGRRYRPVGLFQGIWHVNAERPEMAHVAASSGASLVRAADSVGPVAVERPERSVARLVGGGAR